MPLEPGSVLLDGRVAVVTGAAQGIGRAIAEAFVAFGATVAACDRDSAGLATLAVPIKQELDVRHADSVDAWISTLDRVDVLVNNAGGTFRSPFLDVGLRAQQALVDENFTSVTHFVRACSPKMREGGSIINITSIEAHRAGPGFAVYSAMKAAVANLTKSLSLELGERRIRVNCIAPDDIPTPGVGPIPVKTPLPNQGHVDDVAGAAVFLAGDLSRFVTGTTIHVDGGNWAAAGWHRTSDGSFTPL